MQYIMLLFLLAGMTLQPYLQLKRVTAVSFSSVNQM
jgi:hypothetical protein